MPTCRKKSATPIPKEIGTKVHDWSWYHKAGAMMIQLQMHNDGVYDGISCWYAEKHDLAKGER